MVQRGTTSPQAQPQVGGWNPAPEPVATRSQHQFTSCIARTDQKYIWKCRMPLCERRLEFNLSSNVKAAGLLAQLTSYNDVGGLFCRVSNIVIGDTTVRAGIFRRDGRYRQRAAVEDCLLGQDPSGPHPRQAGGWLSSCCHADQGDRLPGVHHYWVIHKKLNWRGCCKTQEEKEGVVGQYLCHCSVWPSTLESSKTSKGFSTPRRSAHPPRRLLPVLLLHLAPCDVSPARAPACPSLSNSEWGFMCSRAWEVMYNARDRCQHAGFSTLEEKH